MAGVRVVAVLALVLIGPLLSAVADIAVAQTQPGSATLRLGRAHTDAVPGEPATVPLILDVTCPTMARLSDANFQATFSTTRSGLRESVAPSVVNFTFAPDECVSAGTPTAKSLYANLTLHPPKASRAEQWIPFLPDAFANVSSTIRARFQVPGKEWRAPDVNHSASVGFYMAAAPKASMSFVGRSGGSTNRSTAQLDLDAVANGPVMLRMAFDAQPPNVTRIGPKDGAERLARDRLAVAPLLFEAFCAEPTAWEWGANVTLASADPRSGHIESHRVVFSGPCYPSAYYGDDFIPGTATAAATIGVAAAAWSVRRGRP